MSKSICMITHDFPFIDRRILLQAKCLIENGYRVSIIYPLGEANSDFENIGIEYITIDIKSNVKNSLTSIKGIIRELIPQSLYTFLKKSYFKVAPSDFIDYEDELKQKAMICLLFLLPTLQPKRSQHSLFMMLMNFLRDRLHCLRRKEFF